MTPLRAALLNVPPGEPGLVLLCLLFSVGMGGMQVVGAPGAPETLDRQAEGATRHRASLFGKCWMSFACSQKTVTSGCVPAASTISEDPAAPWPCQPGQRLSTPQPHPCQPQTREPPGKRGSLGAPDGPPHLPSAQFVLS